MKTLEANILNVPSRLFGPLTVSPSRLFTFPDGLLGFAGERRFVLLPAAETGVFWLQSADEGNLAFLTIDPFVFFPHYIVDLDENADVPFAADAAEHLAVFAIVTLPHSKHVLPTANLQAPVILHMTEQKGCQHIIRASDYHTTHSFDLTTFRAVDPS